MKHTNLACSLSYTNTHTSNDPHLYCKHTPVRSTVLSSAVDCGGAIMKGNRQHGGPFDEERQVGAGQRPSCPEWPVVSVRRNTGPKTVAWL